MKSRCATARVSWVLIDGTGVYETLRGRGRVTGTADDNLDLIRRTYHGTVHRR